MFDTIAAAELWRFPAWIAVFSATIVFLEAKRLFLLRHIRPTDPSPHARGRAYGQRMGVSVRFLLFSVLTGLLCLRVFWAGLALAALLAHSSIRPAKEFAAGFATGVAQSSGLPPSVPLVALAATFAVVFGRGLLAVLAVIASLVLR